MENEQPVIACPICRKQRPTYEDVLAYKDAPEGSEIHARVEAYNECCNPLCNGNWGTGCWHCHHPKFLDSCPDERVLEIAFRTRECGDYWERLLQLSSERILAAWDSYSRPTDCSAKEWSALHLEVTRFSISASAVINARAEKLKIKAETIMECQLAVCRFCDASAKSGETTIHTCIAAPLKKMLNDVTLQLYGPEEKDD